MGGCISCARPAAITIWTWHRSRSRASIGRRARTTNGGHRWRTTFVIRRLMPPLKDATSGLHLFKTICDGPAMRSVSRRHSRNRSWRGARDCRKWRGAKHLAVNHTPIADMIAEMHASGIQLDTIIVAVRSMERAMSTRHPVDEMAEKRRSWDREYRRNKRAERPPDPPDIHPIPPDVGNIALSLSKEEESYSVKKERKQESKKERGC